MWWRVLAESLARTVLRISIEKMLDISIQDVIRQLIDERQDRDRAAAVPFSPLPPAKTPNYFSPLGDEWAGLMMATLGYAGEFAPR